MLDPMALMVEAATKIGLAGFQSLISSIDALSVVNISSWHYDDPPGELARKIGATSARTYYGEVGGETPVAMLHRAALEIARGECKAVLICGAEAQYSVAQAARSGATLPWPVAATPAPPLLSGRDLVHPLAAACGLSSPAHVYPLYEIAAAAAEKKSVGEAVDEAAKLYSAFSAIAAQNPYAWRARGFAPDEIAVPSAENRMVAWPYPKRMVANPLVNQGAAVLVTSLATAREAGIADDQLVYISGGAAANEPRDFMARDQFARSHAQDAVLEAARTLAPSGFDAMELYSCFPCVPRMAARSLGVSEREDLTVTGGLSFFGAPLSNYMLHAAAAMVRRLKERNGTGLLYGQGEFVTKHHALVLSTKPPRDMASPDSPVQADADARRGSVPPTVTPRNGPAEIETGTVLYRKDGTLKHAALVLRLPEGGRTVATVPAEDQTTLTAIMRPEGNPVGLRGQILTGADNRDLARWRLA